ncbi:hypothetical protein EGR_07817 [Echinococcus granulosus]|uniref:Uncharacterized protein n=1 Tax=Echinococcus granulosus TaxID=6210 RepID=W6U9T1_ECHGR|nr:hypothetical protein EGR_07817 [Echinococcus granulosus]EUB57281.1 hypothetical protein EGR_07817 [Echinococcus granulosus]
MIVDFHSAVKLVSPPEDPHCDAARRICVWLICKFIHKMDDFLKKRSCENGFSNNIFPANTRIEINGTLSQVPSNVTVTRGPSVGEFIFKFMDKEYNHDNNNDDDDGEWGTAGPNSQFKTTSTAVTMTAAKEGIWSNFLQECFAPAFFLILCSYFSSAFPYPTGLHPASKELEEISRVHFIDILRETWWTAPQRTFPDCFTAAAIVASIIMSSPADHRLCTLQLSINLNTLLFHLKIFLILSASVENSMELQVSSLKITYTWVEFLSSINNFTCHGIILRRITQVLSTLQNMNMFGFDYDPLAGSLCINSRKIYTQTYLRLFPNKLNTFCKANNGIILNHLKCGNDCNKKGCWISEVKY